MRLFDFEPIICLSLQPPFGTNQFPDYYSTIDTILNVLYALAVRGYLLLLLVGLIVFATGLCDGFAKMSVAIGILLYLIGPYVLSIFGNLAGVEQFTLEKATIAWLGIFGMTDVEMVHFLVWIGDIILGVCILAGVIMYFTPSSKDLKTRGHSLIVRSLILAPVLVYFHLTAWL